MLACCWTYVYYCIMLWTDNVVSSLSTSRRFECELWILNCELWSLFILMLMLWMLNLWSYTWVLILYCQILELGTWKLYLRPWGLRQSASKHWNDEISMCLWWHGHASASASGKTVARACLSARAACAIPLQGLHHRTGPRPVLSSLRSTSPLIRSSVLAGSVWSWTGLQPYCLP